MIKNSYINNMQNLLGIDIKESISTEALFKKEKVVKKLISISCVFWLEVQRFHTSVLKILGYISSDPNNL